MSRHDEQDDAEMEGGGGGDEDMAPDLGSGETEYIATEEKKPLSVATVALFAVFGAAGLASYFLLVKPASADPAAAAATTDPQTGAVIQQFMTDKAQSFANMRKMLRETDAVVRQFLTYQDVPQVPLDGLKSNPFRMTPVADEAAAPSAKDAEREKKRREEERQAALRAVQNLQLQSVISSDRAKSCMINNVLYMEGQQVDGFTIERIGPNAVIVRNAAYKFELRMQR